MSGVIDLTLDDDGSGAAPQPACRNLFETLPNLRYTKRANMATKKRGSDGTDKAQSGKKRKPDRTVIDLEKENTGAGLFDSSRTFYGASQSMSNVVVHKPTRVANHADFTRPTAAKNMFNFDGHLAKEKGTYTAERPMSTQELRMRNQMEFMQSHATVEVPKSMFSRAIADYERNPRQSQEPGSPQTKGGSSGSQQPSKTSQLPNANHLTGSVSHNSSKPRATTSSITGFAVKDASTTNPVDDPREAIEAIKEPILCKEQKDLVDLIMSGANVFYTGSAGCGKSTVLKNFVKRLKKASLQVDIIAPTGRAALAINGSTTWTYAGWTPDHHKKPLKELLQNAHGKFVRKRLTATNVLVIDEISMVENLHFERLNMLMKEARGNLQAFGGVQIVVTGDFCQLPPVKPFQHCISCGKELLPNLADQTYKCPVRNCGVYKDIDKWAFRSTAWKECKFHHVNLEKIHRQSDKVFVDMLNLCRYGKPLRPKDTELLLGHPCDVQNAVKLFSTKEEVRRVNQANFHRLPSNAFSYPCLDGFQWNQELHQHLRWKGAREYDGSLRALADHKYETNISLKEGMLVVLLTNLSLDEGLVNGSQGIIVGYEAYDPVKLPKVIEKSGRGRESSPGLSLGPNSIGGDYAKQREESIKVFIENPKIVNKKWPIVEFDNGLRRTIFADCTINELGDDKPYSLLSRTQIPLAAAWAMSIHKSQGMTLNKVVVDLSRSFEEGQMYVALSRARSLNGLKVEGLGKTMGRGNEQVKEFLRERFNIQT